MDKEFILCAAIHYRDGIVYKEQPINIESGIVITGRRHNNCFMTLRQLNPNCDENLFEHKDCGFITSLDRFVTRKEAWIIAKENNQIQFGLIASENGEDSILISENLY